MEFVSPIAEEHPPVHSTERKTESIYRFQFRGNTAEYFKIWIVNIALTILTLGIFSAWAKVRNKRYFYANTFLDGANFEYHAKPLSILIARLILFAVIIGGSIWAENNPEFNILYTLLLAFLLPWALVRGLSFNARNSSYRNIKFSFNRGYTFPYIFYILMFSGIGAIIFPLLIWHYHKFKIERHRIGKIDFKFSRPSIWAYIGLLWIVPLLVIPAILLIIGTFHILNDALYPVAVLFSIILIIIAIALMQAGLFQLFWNSVGTKNGAIFRCDFSTWGFAIKILLVNFIASFLSLGLLYPWAKIRKTKFLAENIYIIAAAGTMDEIIGHRNDDENALGEEFEAAEGFDFDVGLI